MAADREYALAINGAILARGSLSSALFKRYDEIDVSGALRLGENVVTVLVYAEGKRFHLTQGPVAQGLLCELFCDDVLMVKSDRNWQSQFQAGWLFPTSHFDDTTYAEFFDARKSDGAWYRECDEDNEGEWSPATECFPEKNSFWGSDVPQNRFYPWVNLLPNEIPQIAVRPRSAVDVRFGEVRQCRQVHLMDTAVRMSLEEFLPLQKARIEEKDGSLLLFGSDPRERLEQFDGIRNPSIIYDFGQIVNGRLALTLEGPSATRIDIGYATSLEGGRVVPYRSQRTPQADHYILRQGRQSWQTFQWRQFRYVQLTFRDITEPVKLLRVEAEETFHPFEQEGEFSSSNDLLNQSVNLCRRTLFLSILDRSMDNGSRERRQYLGDDCVVIVPAILNLHGDVPFLVKYFRQFAEVQHPTGLYPYCQPGLDKDEASLFDHALTFPIQLRTYLMYSGNLALGDELWIGLVRFWRLISSCLNEDGLMSLPPYAIWFDWAEIDRGNLSFLLNGLTCEALEAIVFIGHLVSSDKKLIAEIEEAGTRLRKALSEKWFDPDRGLFADRLLPDGLSKGASENTNAFAVLWGYAPAREVPRIVEAMASGQLPFCSPGCADQPSAFIRADRTDLALEWLQKRVGPLLTQGRESWPETWSLLGETTLGTWRCRDSRAEAQASGLGPLLAAYLEIAGVRPLEIGMHSILVAPRPGPLETFHVRIPSPQGWIALRYTSVSGLSRYELELPMGMTALVRLPVEAEGDGFASDKDAVLQQFVTDLWGVRCQEFSVSGGEKYHFSTCFAA